MATLDGMDMDQLGGIAAAITPTIGLLALFWLVMRLIINADRNEREAMAKLDAADRQKGTYPK